MITFQKESFVSVMPEMPEMFHALWLEQATEQDDVEIDPDWDRYAALDMSGQLHMLTARDEGIMVGYYMALVMPSLHYKTLLTAFADLYYLHPEYRKGMNGVRLFKEANAMLKALGVKKSYVMTNVRFPITIILKRLGYNCIEHAFARFL